MRPRGAGFLTSSPRSRSSGFFSVWSPPLRSPGWGEAMGSRAWRGRSLWFGTIRGSFPATRSFSEAVFVGSDSVFIPTRVGVCMSERDLMRSPFPRLKSDCVGKYHDLPTMLPQRLCFPRRRSDKKPCQFVETFSFSLFAFSPQLFILVGVFVSS